MKVILSRKGFDSGAGGYASPLFKKEGKLFSIPIPEENKIYSANTGRLYSDLRFDDEHTYLDVMAQLGMTGFENKNAHLDPDIKFDILRERKQGFRGMFGQCDAAQGHLAKNNVQSGDLFLFFGWFKDVINVNGRYRFVPGTDKHVIWGYLQIEDIDYIDETTQYEPWKLDHPHYRNRKRKNNAGYIAREWLDFNPKVPGYGILKYNDDLILTDARQKNRTVWNLPPYFHPSYGTKMTYHENEFNKGNKRVWDLQEDNCILNSVYKGQEFVITGNDKVVDWAKNLILELNQQ